MQEPVGTGDTGVVEMVLPGMTENCKATFGLAIFFTKTQKKLRMKNGKMTKWIRENKKMTKIRENKMM